MTRNDVLDVVNVLDVVEIDRGMASKLDTTRINGNVVVRATATTVMIWNHFHVQIIVFIGWEY